MAIPRSAVLAAWASAWLAGRASSDDALAAVHRVYGDAPHRVVGLASTGTAQPLSAALVQWRLRRADAVSVALPVPGDVRGLPIEADLRAAALAAGEAAFGSTLALVPTVIRREASSAPDEVLWHAFEVTPAAPDPLWLADAEHDLTEAIRETAVALTAAQTARWRPQLGEALAGARSAADDLPLPPHYPARAVRLLAQTERLTAALQLADPTGPGDAVDRCAMAARADALAPLVVAVRRARLAGYNAVEGQPIG